ncbi:MAG TPA: response regulator [Polyangiaceae bacterium]|jgi:CheY-like chemotaxis protein
MTRKKIMLVDDSSTALLMEKAILAKRNFVLVTARDGEEAVAMSRAERPDVILMDVMMPKMNGFEACRRIRDDPQTKDIPIIMVTTRGEMENLETGYASGCSDYVTKPINGLELLTKLEDLLGGAEVGR